MLRMNFPGRREQRRAEAAKRQGERDKLTDAEQIQRLTRTWRSATGASQREVMRLERRCAKS